MSKPSMPRATNDSRQNSSIYGSRALMFGTPGWMSQSIAASVIGFSLPSTLWAENPGSNPAPSTHAKKAETFGAQPGDRGRRVRRQPIHNLPEPLAMVHVLQVRDLVRGDIVLHELRGHHQTPTEG